MACKSPNPKGEQRYDNDELHELHDPLDPLGPFPRVAWSEDDPEGPLEERLALVALAGRAASVPTAALLEATPALEDPLAAWRAGVVVHELRRGLAEAALLIAEAPWGRAPAVVSVVRDDAGVLRVTPAEGLGGDRFFRIARQLTLASFVALTDTPFDVRWLPLELAVESRRGPAPPPLDPAAFMFMGLAETPADERLWRYKHIDTRGYLNVDADGAPWRYDPSARAYERCDDMAAALARAGLTGALDDGPAAGPRARWRGVETRTGAPPGEGSAGRASVRAGCHRAGVG